MKGKLCIQMKGLGVSGVVVAVLFAITLCFARPTPTCAAESDMGGNPFSFTGLIKQGAAYGIAGNQYDTKKGIQSLLTQIVLEGKWVPNPDMNVFVSGKYNADQAYPMLSSNSEWKQKDFDKSRSHLYTLDDWQDILGEAHVTVKKGDFYFRVGKQIVKWGETDGFRLMDQINPIDQRRGITDVAFENTVIPTWLVRAEYRPPTRPDWLQDLNYQFIFNPNPKFRGNEGIIPGNARTGIWAPMVDIPVGGPYPFDYAHLGELTADIEKPRDFSTEGFAYAGRITASLWDARLSLNGYYGRSLDYVTRNVAVPPYITTSRYDNRMVISPSVEGYYPYFKFVGATFTKDITPLKASFLGGVSPVLRLETFYAFNSTFTNNKNEFVKYDEFRSAAGMDWKVKVPLLNERAFFTISPQIYLQKLVDYPSERLGVSGFYENNWTSTLMISTSYLHARLQPMFFWYRDWTNKSEFYQYQLVWEHSSTWKYTLGALVVHGDKEGKGMQALEHKDHVYFNVAYKF